MTTRSRARQHLTTALALAALTLAPVVADAADAEHRDPAMVAGHLIELVAVDQQKTASVGGFMHQFVDHLDVTEDGAAVVAQRLVMIARDEHDALALPRPAQQFLDHCVLRLRPADAAAHRPEIDDVADQEGLFGGMLAQEIEETIGLCYGTAGVFGRLSAPLSGQRAASRWRSVGKQRCCLKPRLRP